MEENMVRTEITAEAIAAIVQQSLLTINATNTNNTLNKPRLTKKDVSEITGLSIATIDRRREKGHFANAYMDGGILFIPREDVILYLNSFSKESK